MPAIKLTDAAVKRLKAPPGQRVDYFDAAFPGLALRVTGADPEKKIPERRSWTLFYRLAGKQRRLTFEREYPAISLEEARKQANEIKLQLKGGRDPAAEKAAAKAEAEAAARKPDTFANVADEFIKRHLEGKRRAPRHIEETTRKFRLYVLPKWGERDVKSITRRDVIELLDSIVDEGSTARAGERKRGGPIAANRTLAAVSTLFRWAVRRGIIESSPAMLVEKPGEETSRERILGADELRAVWAAAEVLGYPSGAFVRTLMLTGQRREETATMRWADLDLQEAVWTIPGENTKAGRVQVVPLAPPVVELLSSSLPRIGPYVFSGGSEKPISGYSAVKRRLDREIAKAAAIPPWTLHDLRRTVATELGRLGVARLVVARVLNHADRSVTGAHYDRWGYLPEKRHALETWASYLAGLTQPPGAKVVHICGRAL